MPLVSFETGKALVNKDPEARRPVNSRNDHSRGLGWILRVITALVIPVSSGRDFLFGRH